MPDNIEEAVQSWVNEEWNAEISREDERQSNYQD